MSSTPRPRSGMQGLASLDALVALAVLSVGCLAVWDLSAQALAQHRNTLALQHATWLIDDLAQRWRFNSEARALYQLDWTQQAPPQDCQTQPCTPAQWAHSDVAQWRAQVALQLPHAQVLLRPNADATLWVVLAWSPAGANTVAPSVPNCPPSLQCLALTLAP